MIPGRELFQLWGRTSVAAIAASLILAPAFHQHACNHKESSLLFEPEICQSCHLAGGSSPDECALQVGRSTHASVGAVLDDAVSDGFDPPVAQFQQRVTHETFCPVCWFYRFVRTLPRQPPSFQLSTEITIIRDSYQIFYIGPRSSTFRSRAPPAAV